MQTSEGIIDARFVVAATGPFQRPVIPPIVPDGAVPLQIHSSAYRNPQQLPEGAVLVVGAGSSGVQIADELRRSGRRVHLSVGPHDRPPRAYRGRDFCWWLGVLGMWDAETPPLGAEHVTIAVSGARGGHTVDFRALAAGGIELVGRTASFDDGTLRFAPDLADNIAHGDANYLSLLDAADAYVERNGLDLPEEPEARILGPDPACVTDPLRELDLADAGVTSIIWATGFATDYGWLQVDAFDESGEPSAPARASRPSPACTSSGCRGCPGADRASSGGSGTTPSTSPTTSRPSAATSPTRPTTSEGTAMTDQPVLEKHTIGYVPPEDRHGKVRDLFTLWFGTNIAPLPVVTGAAGVTVFHLDLFWSIAAIVVGHLVGGVFMALHSAQGPADGHPADDPEPRPVRLVRRPHRRGDRGRDVPGLLRLQHRARRPVAARHRGAGAGVGRDRPRRPRLRADLRDRVPVHPRAEPRCHLGARHQHRGRHLRDLRGRTARDVLDARAATPRPASWPRSRSAALWQIAFAPYVSDYSRYLPADVGVRATFTATYLGCTLGSILPFIVRRSRRPGDGAGL